MTSATKNPLRKNAYRGDPLAEPPPPESEPAGPTLARPCGHCGWFVLVAVAACPLCGSTERARA